MPYLFLFYKKKFLIKKSDFDKGVKNVGINDYKEIIDNTIKKDVSVKIEFYAHLLYLPITFILWLFCVGNILSYISVIIVIILTVIFFKLLNTVTE